MGSQPHQELSRLTHTEFLAAGCRDLIVASSIRHIRCTLVVAGERHTAIATVINSIPCMTIHVLARARSRPWKVDDGNSSHGCSFPSLDIMGCHERGVSEGHVVIFGC